MTNKILIGITQKLDTEFGYPVCVDEIEQGLNAPLFLVTPLAINETHEINNRYNRSMPYMIQYFPESEHYRMECNEISERLMNTLNEITLDDGILYSDGESKGDVIEGILKFEVKYKPRVEKVPINAVEKALMENLEQKLKVKE